MIKMVNFKIVGGIWYLQWKSNYEKTLTNFALAKIKAGKSTSQ